MPGGPVIIGTSLLDSSGKVKGPGLSAKLQALLTTNPTRKVAQPPAINPQALATSTTAGPVSTSTPDAYSTLGMTAGQSLASAPSTILPKENAKSAKGETGYSPLQFAAALRQATQELGAFNGSAYDLAVGNAKSQAGTQNKQAKQLGARTEADDAVLYGHLKNYVARLQQHAGVSNDKAIAATQAGYAAAKTAIDNTYTSGQNANNSVLKSRGVTPTNEDDAHNFALGQIIADGANSTANARVAKSDAVGDLRQTKADVYATGVGKVASEKASVNTALENIAAALSGQLGSINESRAGAENTYNSQLRSLAASLQASNAKNDPNTLDNQIKEATLAKDLKTLNPTGTSATGGIPAKAKGYGAALNVLTPNESGIPQSHEGTLQGLLQQAIHANGPFKGLDLTAEDSTGLGSLAQIVHQQINSRSGQGYTNADQQALLDALMVYLGKYS